MIILGIETSCDETAACVLEANTEGFRVLSNVVASQVDIHKKYGGVVPEVAARKQMEAIIPVIDECLNPLSPPYDKGDWRKTQWVFPRGVMIPDVIAVTQGPGLVTSLRIGVQVAKTLAYVWQKPLVAVNHIEGHALSALLDEPKGSQKLKVKNQKKGQHVSHVPSTSYKLHVPTGSRMPDKVGTTSYQFPALALIVSGGHTELILIKDYGVYALVGRTRDDAAGEAFDKVAKLLGLPYPGGPEISKHATEGNPAAFNFPRPMIDSSDYDFSFSGLKTAVLYTIRDMFHGIQDVGMQRSTFHISYATLQNLCASFQRAVVDTLVTKTIHAAERFKAKSIVLGGGVSANRTLRKQISEKCRELSVVCRMSPLAYTTDNAAMIAVAGYFKAQRGEYADWKTLTADPNLQLV